MAIHVKSEIGKLKKVMLHRPGSEPLVSRKCTMIIACFDFFVNGVCGIHLRMIFIIALAVRVKMRYTISI